VTPQGGSLSVQDIAKLLNERFQVGVDEALTISCAVIASAKQEAISPFLLLAVIAVESGFDRYAVSVAGAVGLMQVVPSQHKDRLRHAELLWDARTNIEIGSSILHDYLKASDGDLRGALERYSGGAKGYAARVADRMSQIEVAFRVPAHAAASASDSVIKN
jgi:soluble lytic murein transglycosylase-like protein